MGFSHTVLLQHTAGGFCGLLIREFIPTEVRANSH